MLKKNKLILITISFIYLLSILFFLWFLKTESFLALKSWSEQNTFLFILFIISLKVTGIVWPPLPGGLLTLGSIPLLGWKLAYFSDFTGNIVGSTIAFYIGKKYGHKLVHKIFGKQTVNKLHSIKIKSGKEIQTIFFLKLVGGNILSEAVSYAAGLLKINYKNFIIGSVLAHIVIGVPIYALAGSIYKTQNILFSLTISVVVLVILWRAKGKYFE